MKKTISLLLSILLLTGCTASGRSSDTVSAAADVTGSAASEGTGSAALKEDAPAGALQMKTLAQSLPEGGLSDPYRSTYEVFVYSFADSDGDGIGDLNGLAKSLDYINDGVPGRGDDLGCGRSWHSHEPAKEWILFSCLSTARTRNRRSTSPGRMGAASEAYRQFSPPRGK